MFDRVACLNLDQRPERWEAFCERLPGDWPWAEPERVSAVVADDLTEADFPVWCSVDRYGRACHLSHGAILRRAAEQGEVTLILEDDACFVDRFADRAAVFIGALPDDWDQVYLGGQFLSPHRRNPIRVNEHVLTTTNCNRTHAYAVTPRFAAEALAFFAASRLNLHIDHQYGRMHRTEKYRVYTPSTWLVGQAANQSDIEHRSEPERWWHNFKVHEPRE